jgi:hypothetical protein
MGPSVNGQRTQASLLRLLVRDLIVEFHVVFRFSRFSERI